MRKEVIDLLGGEKAFAKGKKTRRTIARQRLGERLYSKNSATPGHGVAETPAVYGNPGGSFSRAALAGPPTRLFKITSVDRLAARLEVSTEDLMTVLGITGRTAQRRRQSGVLSAEESDRLYRLARVFEKAAEVFGSETSAASWLREPRAFFQGISPLALLGTDAGTQEVENEIGRIEYGVY